MNQKLKDKIARLADEAVQRFGSESDDPDIREKEAIAFGATAMAEQLEKLESCLAGITEEPWSLATENSPVDGPAKMALDCLNEHNQWLES